MADCSAICVATCVAMELMESSDDESNFLLESDRKDRHKTQDFFEWTVPRYFPDMFKNFFKISPQSFELVCQLLGANEQLAKRTYRGGRQEIPLEKKVMIVLRYLASQETILGISDRFNITVSTFTKYREKVVNAINDLLPRFVQWPEELDSVAIKFNEMGTYEFQNIIGAIDGSHIPIEQPLECPNSYYNRKKFHSVILQAVCKDDLSFVNICVGMPGRCHDAKAFKHSHLSEIGDELCRQGQYHILGDAAYALMRWLITPFRDNGNLTREQYNFNKFLSSKRQVIERAFALLKGRFRRLKYVSIRDIKCICKIISACCVLHNICLQSDEDIAEFIDAEIDELDANLGENFPVNADNGEGILKRNNLTIELNRVNS
ncbi:putative nuclease HARBI1 [Mytilus trossulus]|uniref:putative nuclease HARBI1 n=1 Tax=Mytilus trossulus TaxID=6551 RepID=UPI00300639D3